MPRYDDDSSRDHPADSREGDTDGRPALIVCAWCLSVRDVTGRWHKRAAVAAPPHGRGMAAIGPGRGEAVSHGLCPDCATALVLEPDAYTIWA
jgi:hypothetical protein